MLFTASVFGRKTKSHPQLNAGWLLWRQLDLNQ